jgi:hypothetical protein
VSVRGRWKLVLLFYLSQQPRRPSEREPLDALLQTLRGWRLYWSQLYWSQLYWSHKTGARILARE